MRTATFAALLLTELYVAATATLLLQAWQTTKTQDYYATLSPEVCPPKQQSQFNITFMLQQMNLTAKCNIL